MAGFPVSGIAVGALLAGIILTPLFCWYVREDGDAWVVNAVVSTVAFPFWAYLMGAVAFAKFHDGNLAVILILTFTAVSGLVLPWRSRPKLADQEYATRRTGRDWSRPCLRPINGPTAGRLRASGASSFIAPWRRGKSF